MRIWLGILFASLYTFCVTCFLKVYVSQSRPDLVSRCFHPFSSDLQGYPVRVTLENCSVNHSPKNINEDLLSFSSGHSPSAMAASIFVAVRMLVLAHLSHTRGFFFSAQALFLCSIVPIFAGFFICCPSIVDNWHTPVDVTAAFLVGLVCSVYYAIPLISRVRYEHD